MLQSENGLLGMGPYPSEEEVDARLINAGKETVTAVAGASLFDSAASFAMIRGGHVDLAILGGLEVACNGDLANWTVPGRLITGMGGAMDLAAGARRLVVLQSHASKDGQPKLVTRLTLPATALGCVNRVITEMGVFDVGGDCFICVARADGVHRQTIVAPQARRSCSRPRRRAANATLWLRSLNSSPGARHRYAPRESWLRRRNGAE